MDVSVLAAGLGAAFVLTAAITLRQRHRLRVAIAEAAEATRQMLATNDSRVRLIRGISHDLRNPLQAIDGHAMLLAEEVSGPLNPIQLDSALRIRQCSRSLLRLVEDLADLTLAESGKLRLIHEEIDINAIVWDLAEVHRPVARAAGHDVYVTVPPQPTLVQVDAERVRQILSNLLSNAIKYTPAPGEINLRVCRAQAALRSGTRQVPCVSVSVSDTGPGIPPDQIEAVFAEFTRLHGDPRIEGSGLGLAIARRIARLLGGEVTAANRRHGGAIFALLLPIR